MFQLLICTCNCFPDSIQDPTVELVAVSENSLNFTWNEYHHCNNDNILVEYKYELRRASDNTLIYEGSETNTTSISFNNLKPDTEYQYQVRVYVTSLLTGDSRSGYWVQATGKTTLVYGMWRAIYIFDFCD